MTTVTDITGRLAARRQVVPLHRHVAPVVPLRSTHEQDPRRAHAQVESLVLPMLQAFSFGDHPATSPEDRRVRRAEARAYAFAVGIVLHPDDPETALTVKRTLINQVTAGVKDPDELVESVLGGPVPPQAG